MCRFVSHLFSLILTSCLLCLVGESLGGDFPEPFNSEQDIAEGPMPADVAAAAMTVPEGFRVEVFASEPEVRNPIAMTWDHRGRMWVAENYTYAESPKRFEMGLRDRVLILEDRDWDGKVDKRTVFTEDVQVLTSVEVGRGGVWLMCPPQLLFIPDANEDDVPDGPPLVMLDGFTVAESSYHNFANGLRWGPDGWLYGRCGHSCPGSIGKPGAKMEERIPIKGGIWRYDPASERFEVLCHGTTNPWGFDWDEHGELFFINTVNGHLWHMIPGAHFKESFGADPNPLVYDRLDTIADHYHYDTTGKWSESRDGAANRFGGGHAHIGMMIYQADQWPEYFRNKLFTLNMHGRRTNVEKLNPRGSSYVGTHEPDVFLAEDRWFRGMEISTGPDGSAYILDWSDTGECHDHTGVHRTSGRIFKVSHGEPVVPDLEDLEAMTPESVKRLLTHSNAWFVRRCLEKLAHEGRPVEGLEASLERLLIEGETPLIQLRALWGLMGMGSNDTDRYLALSKSRNEHLSAWAVRGLVDEFPLDCVDGRVGESSAGWDEKVAETLVRMAGSEVPASVQLALASALQRLPLRQREKLGLALVSGRMDTEDYALPSMVWWGLSPLVNSDPMAIVRVAMACEWPDTVRWMSRALAEQMEERPEPINGMLELAAKSSSEKRGWILKGVSDGLQGWRKATRPIAWDSVVARIGEDSDAEIATLAQELSLVFGDGRALDAVKQVALDDQADLAARTAALKTLIEARPKDLREVCMKLLDTRVLNAVAVKGLVLFDDPDLGVALAKRYRKFSPNERPAVIDVLVSRAAWAEALLTEVAAGKIPKSAVTPFHARQVGVFENDALSARLAEVWGEVRESSAEKRELVEKLKSELTPEVIAEANLSQGRMLFQAVCAACHVLYGEGGKVGPDLTGSGRSSLEYLLENVVDPSAVVSADYLMSVVTLKDGRVISGVVAAQNQRTLTLRMLTEETTVERTEIEKQVVSPVSMMPEGLLPALQPEQVRDLIAYLMHPSQVSLP